MELAELLEQEGLDAQEVLAWARTRADELLSALPEDLDLEGLLQDMPKLEVVQGGASTPAQTAEAVPAETREAPPASDANLLGEEDDEFEALHTGSFDIIEEGAPEEEGSPYDTGPLPEAAAPEEGAPEEEMEMVESAEIEEIEDIEEIEELDDEELMEFASGEYEMVEDDGEEAEPSRPPAPPSQSAEAGAPDEVEDDDSFDLDLDM